MGSCWTKSAAAAEDKYVSHTPVGELPLDHVKNVKKLPSNPKLSPSPSLAVNLSFKRNEFTREQLERATNGFSDSNFLGKGGFGNVHKGLLEDGRRVAIKQLVIGSAQGDREFQAEVEIITRVHHKHLVALVGWCISDGERMLVYEFVPNNTLRFHLHGNKESTLDWPTRLKIALGSAKGLAYLHEDCHPKIIHRDIKSDNILLDLNFEAKIADFGLAKIFPDDQTHVEATKVAGTFGYVDPEYASTGEIRDKSDVYSFGVILLELITGCQPNFKTIGATGSTRLVAWAWRFLENHNYEGLVDPRLQKNYIAEELARVVECAAACVRVSSQSRPRMIQVVRVLEGNASIDSLKEGFAHARSTNYNSNGHSPTSPIPRSLTLDPAVSEHGTDENTGSNLYYSTKSNEDEGNSKI